MMTVSMEGAEHFRAHDVTWQKRRRNAAQVWPHGQFGVARLRPQNRRGCAGLHPGCTIFSFQLYRYFNVIFAPKGPQELAQRITAAWYCISDLTRSLTLPDHFLSRRSGSVHAIQSSTASTDTKYSKVQSLPHQRGHSQQPTDLVSTAEVVGTPPRYARTP